MESYYDTFKIEKNWDLDKIHNYLDKLEKEYSSGSYNSENIIALEKISSARETFKDYDSKEKYDRSLLIAPEDNYFELACSYFLKKKYSLAVAAINENRKSGVADSVDSLRIEALSLAHLDQNKREAAKVSKSLQIIDRVMILDNVNPVNLYVKLYCVIALHEYEDRFWIWDYQELYEDCVDTLPILENYNIDTIKYFSIGDCLGVLAKYCDLMSSLFSTYVHYEIGNIDEDKKKEEFYKNLAILYSEKAVSFGEIADLGNNIIKSRQEQAAFAEEANRRNKVQEEITRLEEQLRVAEEDHSKDPGESAQVGNVGFILVSVIIYTGLVIYDSLIGDGDFAKKGVFESPILTFWVVLIVAIDLIALSKSIKMGEHFGVQIFCKLFIMIPSLLILWIVEFIFNFDGITVVALTNYFVILAISSVPSSLAVFFLRGEENDRKRTNKETIEKLKFEIKEKRKSL